MSAASCQASSAGSHPSVPVLCLSFTWCRDSDACSGCPSGPHCFVTGQRSPPTFNQDTLGVFSAIAGSAAGAARAQKRFGENPPHGNDSGGSFLSGISSAGATCAEFPGPRWGRASNHTCSQKRTVCLLVEVRALPLPCQLAATQGDRAELIREPVPGGSASLCP